MAETEIKVTTKLPLTSGKEATLTLEDGVVTIKSPVSFKLPAAKLEDLLAALGELEQAQAASDAGGLLKLAGQTTVDQRM